MCRQKFLYAGAVLLVVLLAACDRPPKDTLQWRCDDLVVGCDFGVLRVTADRPPQPMQPFSLHLQLQDKVNAVHASFAMGGMYMGLNRYRMQPGTTQSDWTAAVTLPVCAAGRVDWMMQLDIQSVSGEKQFLVRFHTTS